MKHLHILLAAVMAGIMVWTTGCCSTPPKPAATLKGDLEFAAEVTATVTADQKIIMDGKKFAVSDIPAQLAKRKVSQSITIVVWPESKMTRETLIELIKTLVQNNYFVSLGANSKYADVPIPRS